MRRGLCGVATCGLMLAITAVAHGDGLPVQGVDAGPTGVASATVRYVTLPARPGSTLVAQVRRHGGQVLRSRLLRGSFTIPAVAYDGSPSGLSADAGTLALIRPRAHFPQRRTRLAVLDAKRLRVSNRLTLRGDFSFDALSPDGRTMYLIEYRSRRDPTRYAVRAYELAPGRLLPAPIVDPREPGERMRGLPVTRETSGDGRWAYTLYDGAGSHPFVHALDTARGEAACIDLDALTGFRRMYELRLRSSGRELSVLDGATVVATIDRATFRVAAPAASSPRPPSPQPSSSGAVSWVPPAIGAALLLALLATAARMARRSRVSTS